MNSKDLIYYEQSGGGIKSLGFNFKNILLEKGLPVSYSGKDKNTKDFYNNINNYCVPTALVLLNKRVEDIHSNPTIFDLYEDIANSTTKKGSYEYDDLYSTLLNLSGFRKSKTRKHKKNSKNKNTRKKR
jgi:hypothetical protein